MKIAYFYTSLLAVLASAASVDQRSRDGALKILPELDESTTQSELSSLEESEYQGEEEGDMFAQACPAKYPYKCSVSKYCCPYRVCCRNECCLPSTDYCGRRDGRCYRYT